MSRVLVVATSRKTRGGITSVVKAHESGEQWKLFHCHWVQTHRDGPTWRKIIYFIGAFLDYGIRLPFYDIIHLHISQPTTILRKSAFLNLAKLFRKKIIVHFHAFNVEDTIKGQYSNKYIEFFSKANRVIVLSNWWKHELTNAGVTANLINVLYNPCPRVITYNDSRGNIILYAGTVNKRKGYADLIRAFAKINTMYPDWILEIAGNGKIEQGKNLCRELGIADNVRFLGWLENKEKEAAFNRASIFCLPSYAEGFPMAVLDAWAYGLPVITTPVGGIPDIATDGKNILLFNPGDIDKLAEQLERMISDEMLRTQISRQSEILAKTTFNQDTINQQLADLYASL